MSSWRHGWLVVLWTLLGVLGSALPAYAISAEVVDREPSLAGADARFRAVASDAVGSVEYRWDFGDGVRTEYVADLTQVDHSYVEPGHYAVIVIVRDEETFTSASFVHTVHTPLWPERARGAATIVYDEAHDLVCNVNPDNDTVSFIHAGTLEKVSEVAVYQGPESLAIAPDGKLWVVHQDDYAVAVIDLDTLSIERGIRLPYGSQPMGIVMSPTGDAAYVSLMARGELLQLHPESGATLATINVGPWARGLSVSHDGEDVYLTRFISPSGAGEVMHVSTGSGEVEQRFELIEDTTTEDTDQQGRGLPNYLFSVALSPDGREAWVPSKKDNMARGLLRDGLELSQDNTVRPMLAVIDLQAGAEQLDHRIDLDDRNLPVHVEFSPLGDYAFVTVMGSNLIEVRDAYSKAFVTALRGTGFGPRSSVLTSAGQLFVHGMLSRAVVVYDVSRLLNEGDQTTVVVAEVPVVASETLDAEVLRGKQIFYNSEDQRMSQEGYLSCASCHFDGFEDGRVWEFSDRGEGLRNTISLLGRRGTGHGRVHWSANFDEIHDFEGAIRSGQAGTGFLPDDLYFDGTRSEPLGDPKAGLSPDLDALARYVTSLEVVNRSPFRNSDGTLTEAAEAGKDLFEELECNSCHLGPDFTDSAQGVLHDVGTLKETSGQRLGGPLEGIDTPTLLGVWETAPYLHDGSAPTLRDVLTTLNPDDLHGAVNALSSAELDQLIAYLQQIDGDPPVRDLPEIGAGGEDGAAGAAGAGGAAGAAGDSLDDDPVQAAGGCSCSHQQGSQHSFATLLAFVGLVLGRRRLAQR